MVARYASPGARVRCSRSEPPVKTSLRQSRLKKKFLLPYPENHTEPAEGVTVAIVVVEAEHTGVGSVGVATATVEDRVGGMRSVRVIPIPRG